MCVRIIKNLWSSFFWRFCIKAAFALTLFLICRYVAVGFCFKEGRYLSDKEYILPALTEWMKTGELEIGPSDTSAEAYLANHLNCCTVYRNRSRPLLDALFDINPITIGWYFKRNEEKLYWMPKDTYWGAELNYSSCGEFLSRGIIAPGPVPSPEYWQEEELKVKSRNQGF